MLIEHNESHISMHEPKGNFYHDRKTKPTAITTRWDLVVSSYGAHNH